MGGWHSTLTWRDRPSAYRRRRVLLESARCDPEHSRWQTPVLSDRLDPACGSIIRLGQRWKLWANASCPVAALIGRRCANGQVLDFEVLR